MIFIIIQRINELLKAKNLTASQFLKSVKLPNSAITEWNKGKAKPSLEAVVKIANYFEISVDYLLGRTDNPEINRSKITKITELKNKSTNAQIAAFSGNDLKAEHTIDEEIAIGRRIEKK